jgi:Mlc titration factor MtfA (ptsG expression regulator)
VFDWWRQLTRADVIAAEFPAEFREHVRFRVPCAALLDEAELAKLEALIRIFNAEKSFEGGGGLTVTEEMRIAVAARACLLVLQRMELDEPLYPGLDTIIIYPSTYRARVRRQEGYVMVEDEQARLGESWTRGVVVLAWDAVLAGAANLSDGRDVVLHEFAHQLDGADGEMDGTPELDDHEHYGAWSVVAAEAYQELREAVEHRRKTFIDAYGATNGPEFFAVVVEQFFEQPRKLSARYPDLYAELALFFKFDPAQRLRERSARLGPQSAQ